MEMTKHRLPIIILLLLTCIILTSCSAKEEFYSFNYDNSPYNKGFTMNTNQSKSISEANSSKQSKMNVLSKNKMNYSGILRTTASVSVSSFVSKLKIASKIDQLICVIGNGSNHPTITYYSKDAEGIWHQQFKIKGDCGYKGITYHKKEGDKKTPAGLYPFTIAFGIKSNPGTILSYHHVTKYDYWIDDTKSPYYNTLVNSKKTPGKYKSEHLIDEVPSYNYALNIDYNPDCIPGIGSAIFLHCTTKSGRTAGCIAIPEKYMKKLLQTINESAMILIVPSEKYLANY